MGFINPGRDKYGRTVGQRKRSAPRVRGGKRRPIPEISISATSSAASSRAVTPTSQGNLMQPPQPQPQPQPPPPPARPPPTLESLPTELLQEIFLFALNPSLPAASRALSTVLTGPHLRRRYLHEHRHCADDLSRVFTARFFTAEFLEDYERLFTRLDAAGTWLPLRLLYEDSGDLIAALIDRGAKWDPDAYDAVLEGVREALVELREGVVGAALRDEGVVVDTNCLRVAVAAGVGRPILEVLVERGADAGDVRVWRAALDHRDNAVEWLFTKAAPPGEVLGELMGR
jgi:hypothetical protein